MFTSLFQLEQKAVTVFSSADKGAPTLTADAGSLKTLLKACLVTGYGDKSSLGWQIAHESDEQNSAVFLSNDPTSSKFCLKVDNTSSAVSLSAYQSMTSLDVGDKPFAEDYVYNVPTSNWLLIGHSKTFILLLDINVGSRTKKIAYPLMFGDLPKQTRRVEPLCVLWCGRFFGEYNSGGLQSTLFVKPHGNDGNGYSGADYAACYAVAINSGQGGAKLTRNHCRFDKNSYANATVLYEMVLSVLPDSTWTLIPMLQPLSTKVNDVANLGYIHDTAIKVTTGDYDDDYGSNCDCVVPTDWWYA